MLLPPPAEAHATEIKQYLRSVIHRLKARRVWHYIEPATRGWLELASKLENIKFRSQTLISVLIKILNRVRPLLDFPGLMTRIGIRHAWNISRIATSWGNNSAEQWKNNKAFQLYCGLLALQLSKIIPNLITFETDSLKKILNPRGFRKMLSILRKIS